MTTSDHAAGEGRRRAVQPRSRLFAVRLWTEEVAGGWEYRGTVQDVIGRAFLNFRDWSDLTAFMVGRMEVLEDERNAQSGCGKGVTPWPLEE